MCGICGILAPKDHRKVNRDLLERMCQTMSHRGPDDEGFYVNDGVGLGHRRLSIIDLNTGQQPITNEDGSVWIILNGEIYNYKALRKSLIQKGHHFKTQTDTEVIVHLYEEKGVDFVKDLRGMFALAIWDENKRRLVLARDRLGQKPLFYARINGSFIFASEIKAILQSPEFSRRLNAPVVNDFLTFKFIPRTEDLFEGVYKLPPASTLVLDGDDIAVNRYWELYYEPDFKMTEEEALLGTEEILRESVRLRLMSDVPLGAFLSSGIDSGVIVGMMSGLSTEPINTFSIGNRVQGFNELPHAGMIAKQHHTNHREFMVRHDSVKMMPDLIWSMDGPFADIPVLPMYYVAKIARQYVTVALTGDGGDESFAGYDRYIANYVLGLYRNIPRPIRSRLVPRLLTFFYEKTSRKSWRQTLRWLNTTSLHPDNESYARGINFFSFDDEEKQSLYTPQFKEMVGEVNSLEGLLSKYWSSHANEPLNKMTYTDIMVRIPEYSNVKVDRISMMHGLEARSPFMDHKLVEFAATIPPRLKIKGKKRKYMLREVARSYIPTEVLNLPKQGFSAPINQWLRHELRDLAHDVLGGGALVKDNLMKKCYIDRLLGEHESKRVNNGYKIWSLLNLEIWYRIYFGNGTMQNSMENLKDTFNKLKNF